MHSCSLHYITSNQSYSTAIVYLIKCSIVRWTAEVHEPQVGYNAEDSYRLPMHRQIKNIITLYIKTSLETLLRRKATGEKGPATELEPGTYTLLQSFSHELSIPATNPSFLIALCTGRRCAAIHRPL